MQRIISRRYSDNSRSSVCCNEKGKSRGFKEMVGCKIGLVLLLLISLNSIAWGDAIVDEIVILTELKTDAEIIYGLLPFRVGDLWRDEYLLHTYLRLSDLDIFDDRKVRIGIGPSSINGESDNIQVTLYLEESGLFYSDLLGFAVDKAVQVYFKEIEQKIYNPLGNGISLIGGYCWGRDEFNRYYYLGVIGPIDRGWNYTVKYMNFDMERDFVDGREFESLGWDVSVEVRNYITPEWKQYLEFSYYDGETYIGQSLNEQRIVRLHSKSIYDMSSKGIITLNGTYYEDFNSDPSSWKIDLGYFNRWPDYRGSEKVLQLKGGYAGKDTPLNFQFTGGGFSETPLRGSTDKLVGLKYVTANLEYHRSFNPFLTGVVFSDLGGFWSEERLTEVDWKVNVGVGVVALNSLRGNLAYSLTDREYGWSVGFGRYF